MLAAVRTSESSDHNILTRQYNPEDNSEHKSKLSRYSHAGDKGEEYISSHS
jgi:hypothetical protein